MTNLKDVFFVCSVVIITTYPPHPCSIHSSHLTHLRDYSLSHLRYSIDLQSSSLAQYSTVQQHKAGEWREMLVRHDDFETVLCFLLSSHHQVVPIAHLALKRQHFQWKLTIHPALVIQNQLQLQRNNDDESNGGAVVRRQ